MIVARAIAVAALAATLGCSGSDAADGGDLGADDLAAGAPDFDPAAGLQPCTDVWTRLCNALDGCYPSAVKQLFGTAADCIQQEAQACAKLTIVPQNNYGPTQEAACAAAIAGVNIGCDQLLVVFVTHAPPSALPTACRPGAGSENEGAPCASANQCKSLGCHLESSACGLCQAPSDVDGPCATSLDCKPGLVCGGGTCLRYGLVNDGCDPDHPCLPSVAGCVDGQCMALADADVTCSPTGAGAPRCNPWKGLTCASTNKCAPAAEATSGKPCNASGRDAVLCVDGSTCVVSDAATGAGTCRPRAQPSEPCSTDGVMRAVCATGLVCVGGQCQAGDPLGCHS